MSKGELLRGFVAERLAAATQEILGAVDRIVAGYEEEAAGFRQETERQRRQLEALLQPLSEPDVKRSRSLGPVEGDEGESAQNVEDMTDQTPSRSSQHKKRKPGRPPISETQTHVDLRIRILPDSRTKVLSNSILQKCPMLRLQCPPGLQEADFMDLLKSTFPQLDGDHKHFDMLTADKGRRLQPLNVESATPEEIHRNINSTGGGTSTLYIRLKTQKERRDDVHQRKHSEESAMLLVDETRPQTSPVQQVEGSRVGFVSSSSTSHQDKETVHADDENHGISEACVAERNDDIYRQEEEVNISAELKGSDPEHQSEVPETKAENSDVLSCKVCGAPHQSEVEFAKHAWSHVEDPGSVCGLCGEISVESLKDHLESHHRTNDGESLLSILGFEPVAASGEGSHRNKTFLCGVCGKSLSDYRSLTRHKMTHSGERPHGCQICGRRFKLPGTLRQHEKIHTDRKRSYLCDVCCKMFLTSKQLQIHMRTHTNDKPYHCGECGKGFTTKGPLTVHMRVHTGETPYRCPDCGWSFKRKANLDNHVRVHSGSKPFVCGICGKECARKTYLTVHMRTHNGERPYKCILCDKAFTQSHCLKTHMRRHLVTGAAT